MSSDAVKTMNSNLEAKTGKSLAQWVAIAKKSGEAKHGGIVKHLKGEHALTHGYANYVALECLQSASIHADDADLVAAQYAGKKAGLKPLYEQILEIADSFGDDVEVAPKKAYVSLRRKKQFATVQPSTATRMDIGINLKGAEAEGMLQVVAGANSMCSHKIELTDAAMVNTEFKSWLKKAYDAAG